MSRSVVWLPNYFNFLEFRCLSSTSPLGHMCGPLLGMDVGVCWKIYEIFGLVLVFFEGQSTEASWVLRGKREHLCSRFLLKSHIPKIQDITSSSPLVVCYRSAHWALFTCILFSLSIFCRSLLYTRNFSKSTNWVIVVIVIGLHSK